MTKFRLWDLQGLEFMLRAFISLKRHSTLNDEEIHTIWFNIKKSHSLEIEPSHFWFGLQEALIKEQISFSPLLGWLMMFGWLSNPTALTHHDKQPVFLYQTPFLLMVNANLLEAIDLMLSDTRNTNLYIQLLQESPCLFDSVHPLKDFLNQSIPTDTLCKKIKNLILHENEHLSFVGAYLALQFTNDSKLIDLILECFPKIIGGSPSELIKEKILEHLLVYCEKNALPIHFQAFNGLTFPLNTSDWVIQLAKTKQSSFVYHAAAAWKTLPATDEKEKAAIEISKSLLEINPRYYLHWIVKNISLKSCSQEQKIALFHLGYTAFKKKNLAFDVEDLKSLYQILQLIVPYPCTLKNPKSKDEFEKNFKEFIELSHFASITNRTKNEDVHL